MTDLVLSARAVLPKCGDRYAGPVDFDGSSRHVIVEREFPDVLAVWLWTSDDPKTRRFVSAGRALKFGDRYGGFLHCFSHLYRVWVSRDSAGVAVEFWSGEKVAPEVGEPMTLAEQRFRS